MAQVPDQDPPPEHSREAGQEHGQETGLVENGQVEPMTGSDKPENSQTISSHYHSILNNQLILFILIKRL